MAYDLESPLAMVDLETTGSQPAWDRITEIGGARGRRLRGELGVVDAGQSRRQRFPAPIQALTGITNEMVARAPTLRAARRRAARAARRARLRRAQRALRLRLPAPRVRARRPQVPGEDAVHRAAFAPPLPPSSEPRPRQPDRAPRHRLPGAPPRPSGCRRAVAVPAHRRARARRRGARGRGATGGAAARAAAASGPRRDRRDSRRARRVRVLRRSRNAALHRQEPAHALPRACSTSSLSTSLDCAKCAASTGSAPSASSARCCARRSS